MIGFNWVDLVILGIIFFSMWEALGRPLILEILDLFSFLLALIFSLRFYNLPASLLSSQFAIPRSLSLALGFMAVWFLTEAIFFGLARSLVSRIHLPKIPKSVYLAVIPAALRSLLLVAFLLVLLQTFPVQPNIKKAVLDSKMGSLILSKAYQLETPIKQVFGGISQDSLTFLTIKPQTNERVDLGFQTTNFKISESNETAMINLVNKERTSKGFGALTFDSKLQEVGRVHSKDMFTRGYFSHYSPEGESVADRANSAGVSYMVIGENLAYAPSLELAHTGLMNSEGHRANILSPDFHKIGIGILDGGVYGLMITQVFSN